jgi:hypothetical protein
MAEEEEEEEEDRMPGEVVISWLQRGSFRTHSSGSPRSYTRCPPLRWERAFGGTSTSLQASRLPHTTVEALLVVAPEAAAAM